MNTALQCHLTMIMCTPHTQLHIESTKLVITPFLPRQAVWLAHVCVSAVGRHMVDCQCHSIFLQLVLVSDVLRLVLPTACQELLVHQLLLLRPGTPVPGAGRLLILLLLLLG